MKRLSGPSRIIYAVFALLYLGWIVLTYKNIVHMDMINVVNWQVKHLYEHDLHFKDLFYDPLFPAFGSLVFSLFNAWFFHLNTVYETVLGAAVLIGFGYIYLKELGGVIGGKRQQFLFAILTGIILFGLHKWEATFTSFFSFPIFLDFVIFGLSDFFIVKYITGAYGRRKAPIVLFLAGNFWVILDLPPYYYSYIISAIILLVLIKRYSLFSIDTRRWKVMLLATSILFVYSVLQTYILQSLQVGNVASKMGSISGLMQLIAKDPIWVIKFYLIGESGPYLGEALDHFNARALFGAAILIAYAFAIWYVIKKKDRRLMVPVALILYNIISYAFVTMGRTGFSNLSYGASSRYTAANLSGVLGLSTILFFILLESNGKVRKAVASFFMIGILFGYAVVDKRQAEISKYRSAAFLQMRNALLTGEGLGILQAEPDRCVAAIEVLRKYKLNVYYGYEPKPVSPPLRLSQLGKITLVSGQPAFVDLKKQGFYDNENGISWTNGNADIDFDGFVEVSDTLTIDLNAYLPVGSKVEKVVPKLAFFDADNKKYLPDSTMRKGGLFSFHFDLDKAKVLKIKRINLTGDTIDASPDKRVLSFPFISLELRAGK